MDSPTALRGARDILMNKGVTAASFQAADGRCCFIGALAITEYGTSDEHQAARGGQAYQYVIEACKSLLPGWDHGLVTQEIYGNQYNSKLPEAVLARACNERAGKEIAGIVMTRAIKLAEADIIATAKVADEAEMHAHGHSDLLVNLTTGEVFESVAVR